MFSQGLKWNIVLLTMDKDKGYAAQTAARIKGFKLRWYSMDSLGKISAAYTNTQHQVERLNMGAHSINKLFQLTTEPIRSKRAVSVPKRVPVTGETVIQRNGTVLFLKEAQMTDHISVTYATSNPNFFAKVYTTEALQLDILQKKATRMLQSEVKISGVCWPTDILNNTSGYFVGVLIPASKGVQLTRSVLNGTTGLSQYFPLWDRLNLCMLAVTILDKICKIHDLGLLFGCINPASIYITDSETVYFVDTDCWQIDGYPALSRNQTFTPPELLQENKMQLLYTIDQENYQVALLTFMIMMPGKFPYAKGKNTSERDSIVDMAFPFSVGGGMRRSQDAERPSGVWRIVWDHLPYQMCDSFYNTFHSKGRYSSPGRRIKDTIWLDMCKEFGRLLSNSDRVDSRSIFPHTFRYDGKRTFVRCSICGQEHPDFYFMHYIYVYQEKIDIWGRGYRICLPCSHDQSNMSFTCDCCGRRFYYTNRTKVLHEIGKSDFDFKQQRWCRDCKKRTVKCGRCGREVPIYQIREFEDKLRNLRTNVCGDCFKELLEKVKREREAWKNSIACQIKCRSCPRSFSLTNGEVEYFKKKGLKLPTRCPICRQKRY